MTTRSEKLRKKMAGMAKEREEFELQKKMIAEDMKSMNSASSLSLSKMDSESAMSSIEGKLASEDHDDAPAVKRTISKGALRRNISGNSFRRISGENAKASPDKHPTSNSDKSDKQHPIPSGKKISDWCYTSPPDSMPPIIKGQQDLYVDVRFLGRGAFGTVDLYKNKEDNKLYAVKTMLVVNKADQEGFLHEVKYLRNRHPFIIHLHDAFMTSQPKKIFLVMHYCESGDLGKSIALAEKNQSPIAEVQIVKWLCHIALAINFLHGLRIVHRDIKPQNILLSDSGEVAQLADFGLATEMASSDDHFAPCEVGTPFYTAPEMINAQPCSFHVDNWSLGCVLFELLALQLPFDGEDTVSLVKSILNDNCDLSLIPKNIYTADLLHIVEGLLCKDPVSRMTTNEVLSHQGVSVRVAGLPSTYRPKYLEERLKRAHVKQLNRQLEKLGITHSSATSTSVSVATTPCPSPNNSSRIRTPQRCNVSATPSPKSESRSPAPSPVEDHVTAFKEEPAPVSSSTSITTGEKNSQNGAPTEKEVTEALLVDTSDDYNEDNEISANPAHETDTADLNGTLQKSPSHQDHANDDSSRVNTVSETESKGAGVVKVNIDMQIVPNKEGGSTPSVDLSFFPQYSTSASTASPNKATPKATNDANGASNVEHVTDEVATGENSGAKDRVLVLPRITVEKASSPNAQPPRPFSGRNQQVASSPQLPSLSTGDDAKISILGTKTSRHRVRMRRHSAHPLSIARIVAAALPFQDRRCQSGTARVIDAANVTDSKKLHRRRSSDGITTQPKQENSS